MKLNSAAALAAALFLLPFAAFAADGSAAPPGNAPNNGAPSAPADGAADTTQTSDTPFQPGDQTFSFGAGLQIPAFILPASGGGVSNLDLGGSLSFYYQYFIAPSLALGGNLSGSYSGTIGDSSVFIVPIGATISYWWTKLPFEFSVLGEIGGYIIRYNSDGIISPFAKAGGGAYYRLTPSWSVGLQAYFWFLPEIHYGNYTNLDAFAGIIETSIGAIYHL
jgi:hypothetical protein